MYSKIKKSKNNSPTIPYQYNRLQNTSIKPEVFSQPRLL